jgi:hypothetical protein
MQFKRTVFSLDIYGEKLEIKKLNTSEMLTYQKELEKCEKDSDAMSITLEMLEKQGIEKDIAKNMEIDHLNKLVSAICGTSSGK